MISCPDSCTTLWPLQPDGSPGLGRRRPPQGHQRGAARLAHPPAHGELLRDVAEIGQGRLRGETGRFVEKVGYDYEITKWAIGFSCKLFKKEG